MCDISNQFHYLFLHCPITIRMDMVSIILKWRYETRYDHNIHRVKKNKHWKQSFFLCCVVYKHLPFLDQMSIRKNIILLQHMVYDNDDRWWKWLQSFHPHTNTSSINSIVHGKGTNDRNSTCSLSAQERYAS